MGMRWPAWLGGREGDRERSSGLPHARMLKVPDDQALQTLIGAGESKSAVLFLHDPWCPVSAHAFKEVERVDADIHVVDVSSQRSLSQAVETLTGIRHESPQVFVFGDGRLRWHASHWGIKRSSLQGILNAGRTG